MTHNKTNYLLQITLSFILILLITANISVSVLADSYSVSTKDGVTQNGATIEVATNADGKPDWQQSADNENTYYLYLDGAQEGDDPIVTLVMGGNVWTYYFTVVDSETAEYYVTEFVNRDGNYILATEPSNQLVDENGNIIYYTVTNSNGSVTLYNTLEDAAIPTFGNLTLTKYVSGSNTTDKFQFTITLSYGPSESNDTTASLLTGWQTYGDLDVQWTSEETSDGFTSYTSSVVTYLANGESVTLSNIPAGVFYVITESGADGYEKDWTNSSGTITADETKSVICTNTEIPSDPEPTGSIIVEKLVTDANGIKAEDNTDTFSMRLSLTDLNLGTSYNYTVYNSDDTESSSGSYTVLADGSADVSFTLMNGQYAKFTELPVDCGYQVLENAIEGYTASYELTSDDGGSYTSSNGTNYEENQDLATAKETLDSTEVDSPVTVTFINKLPESFEKETVNVSIVKKWLDANGEDESSAHNGETITIYLLQTLDSDSLNEGNVIGTAFLNGEDDNWTYTFTDLDRYNDAELEYYYYIREETVDGYAESLTYSTDENDNYYFTLTNKASIEMPETGGNGTLTYTILGLSLTACAVICWYYLRRKQKNTTC